MPLHNFLIKMEPYRITRQLLITSRTDDIEAHYMFEGDLGKGAYGQVKLAVHIITGQRRAIKILPKSRIKDYVTFQNEFEILIKLDHPHVVKVYETYENDT